MTSSAHLSRAAIECGLDQFILDQPFTGTDWQPLYVDAVLKEPERGKRFMSINTLASVLQSLVAAGWRMGDYPTALEIVKRFFPKIDMLNLDKGRKHLLYYTADLEKLPENLKPLEKMAGYSFERKSLLAEAMTHGSDIIAPAAYDRLALLGSAVLDSQVTTELLSYEKLSHTQMHYYRCALTNRDYLGFIAMEWSTSQKRFEMREGPVETTYSLPFWKFMKHASRDVAHEQQKAEERYKGLQHKISKAIRFDPSYPWALLAELQPNDFFSDIIKAFLGAVWIDSGSMEECKKVMTGMGIMRLLERLVRDQVHAVHPRDELTQLAGSEEVKLDATARRTADKETDWVCKVRVGNRKIVQGIVGRSQDASKTLAADEAVSTLRLEKGILNIDLSYSLSMAGSPKNDTDGSLG